MNPNMHSDHNMHSELSCEDFLAALEAAVETRAALAPAAIRHGRSCSDAACRECFEEFELLEMAIGAWKSHRHSSASISDRVVQSLVATDPQSTVKAASRQPVSSVAAFRRRASWIALALILAVGLSWKSLSQPTAPIAEVQQVSPALQQTPPVNEAPAVAVSPEAENFPIAWLDAASDRITSTVAFILPVDDETSEGPAAVVPAESRWSERLKPLEETLDATWKDLFVPVVPDQSHREALPANTAV